MRHTGAQGFGGQITHGSQLSSDYRGFLYAQPFRTIKRLLLISQSAVSLDSHTPYNEAFYCTSQHNAVRLFQSSKVWKLSNQLCTFAFAEQTYRSGSHRNMLAVCFPYIHLIPVTSEYCIAVCAHMCACV